MKCIQVLALALCVGLAAVPANAAEVGDPAAALEISKWVKGGPVDLEAVRGKKVVVVEFWATWCGPCRTSIPHLTEMAEKYKKDVLFVGVTREEADVVEPFVEKMGKKMDYAVAIDKDGKTNAGYMTAYGQGNIPHAFIVDRQGKMAWNAHPMTSDFEEALKAVIAGTFDAAAAKAERAEAERIKNLTSEYFTLSGKEKANARYAEIEKEFLKHIWKSSSQLDTVAWNIASRDWKYQNLEFALRAVEQACELTKNKDASVLETYARVYWEMDRKAEAIKYQEKAVAQATSDREKEARKKTLDKFQSE